MHLIPPPPHPILRNLCFLISPGYYRPPREIENNAYPKFGGANKVHYGRGASAYVLESTLWISDSRYWIPDSFSRWNLDSGFLRPGFHIPQAKISCFSDSDIKILWIPESEYPHMGDSTYPPSVFSIKRNCSLFLWVPLLYRHSFTAWLFVKKIAENSIRSNNKREKSNEGGA